MLSKLQEDKISKSMGKSKSVKDKISKSMSEYKLVKGMMLVRVQE